MGYSWNRRIPRLFLEQENPPAILNKRQGLQVTFNGLLTAFRVFFSTSPCFPASIGCGANTFVLPLSAPLQPKSSFRTLLKDHHFESASAVYRTAFRALSDSSRRVLLPDTVASAFSVRCQPISWSALLFSLYRFNRAMSIPLGPVLSTFHRRLIKSVEKLRILSFSFAQTETRLSDDEAG